MNIKSNCIIPTFVFSAVPMPPFLHQTALYIHDNYRDQIPDVAVILPNRRGGLFFRKYLAELLPATSWSPAVFSIEDFISSLSGLKEAEQVHCLVELYEAHREVEGEQARPFDEFLNWGAQLLADFNEVDRYLADPGKLFTYLDEVRAMTVWNPDREPLTEFQQNYLKFYHSLLSYYLKLKVRLLAKGQGTQGLIFRHAWERLQKGEVEIPWKHLVFAGFNALTTAEEKIIGHLIGEGRAELLWDADAYYVDQKAQEAGTFLRDWFRKWPESAGRWKSKDLETNPVGIEIIGVPDVIGQVKYCGELVQGLAATQPLDERIAIVLPDERLLLPLLNSIPDLSEEKGRRPPDLNITMGLPLSQTPLADLLDLVFGLHLRAKRMKKGSSSADRFYYRDVVRVLQHPYINRLAAIALEGNQFALRELVEKIRKGTRVFLQMKDLHQENPGLFQSNLSFLEPVFSPWESPETAINRIQELVEAIAGAIRKEHLWKGKDPEEKGGYPEEQVSPVELEYAWALARMLHQLRHILSASGGFFTWDSLYKFFRQLLETTSLPFYGEPLKGLQIMGMLETRTLDFEQIILLSCNEGILPSGRTVQSFIPFDVKRDFHLPTYTHKDAIYAYHFYRLLQRAKRVWLLYNTESDSLGGGEPSRYLKQLQEELRKYNPNATVHESFLNTPVGTGSSYPFISIPKQGAVLEKLIKKASDGFAPTAMNAYRACPLRFYYSDIAGLKEPEEVADSIDPQTLGKAVHEALRNLYLPFKGKTLGPAGFIEMETRIDALVDQAFEKKFKGDGLAYGKNLLLVQVAKIMIRKFLRKEKQLVEELSGKGEKLTIVLLEQPLNKTLRIRFEEGDLEVKIKGFVDRVDRTGSITRVIDYKTGSADAKELQIADWDDLVDTSGLDKGFQLLTYAWMVAGEHQQVTMQAGILSLQKQSQGLLTVSIPGETNEKSTKTLTRSTLDRMEGVLKDLLQDIYDREKPFLQTGDPDSCTYCPYLNLCGR
ncbi:MAG: PD-(D/E)XK nuclease family protein [bacterium]